MRFASKLFALTFCSAFTFITAAQDQSPTAEMLRAATLGDEAHVLELRARIDLLPKPDRGDRKVSRSLNEAGLKALAAGDIGIATSNLERATQADSSDVEILNNYAYALLKAKQYSRAKDALMRSIMLAPGRTSAWFNLGEVLAEQGDKANAVAAFDIAYTFSQNRDKTKEFLAKIIGDSSSPALLVAAATEAAQHEGVKSMAAPLDQATPAGAATPGTAGPVVLAAQTLSASMSSVAEVASSPQPVASATTEPAQPVESALNSAPGTSDKSGTGTLVEPIRKQESLGLERPTVPLESATGDAGSETLLEGGNSMVIWLVVLISAIWVYFDAKSIGVRKGLIGGFFNLGAGSWCAVTLLLWIIGFPAYLIKRGDLKAAAAAGSATTAGAATSATASVAAQSERIANLEKLATLRDRGVLNAAEFELKKKELLA